MNYTQHIKKILIGIFLIQIASSSILLYLGHYQYTSVLNMTIQENEKRAAYLAENLFGQIINEYVIYGNELLEDPGVIEALAEGDRQALLKLSQPTYQKLKRLNPFLYIMHFHTADTHSFLRIHKPEKFGDDLRKLRPIILKTNQTKQMQTGFELGKYGIYYRITFPLFKGQQHLGTFEFGIDIKYLISKLKAQSTYTPFLLITKEAAAPIYKHDEKADNYLESFNEKYALVRYAFEDEEWADLVAMLDERVFNGEPYLCSSQGKEYLIFRSYMLQDYTGRKIGHFAFIEDMDYYIDTIGVIRWLSIVTTILLLVITVGLIYRLIRSYTAVLLRDQKELERLTITDPLTQLYNRRYFNEVFDREIKRSKRAHRPLTFLMIDVDNFKQYNDTYGHDKGDIALEEISAAMKACLKRPSDYLFRLGGEEFGVLINGLSPDESAAYAEMLRKSVESMDIEHQGNPPYLVTTVSIGLYSVDFATEDQSGPDIYRIADQALYKAKDNGRNRVMS